MESDGSSPHSQELVTCPNTEPDQNNPLSHFLQMHFNIIFPSKPRSSSYLTPFS